MASGRSLVVINYFSAALAAEAVASARAASSSELDVVIVDNSCDSAEASRLRSIRDARIVASPSNLGYAGGINSGVALAAAPLIIAANPDIVFAPGSIDRLAESIDAGAGLAGPRLAWDDAAEWLLPPADLVSGSMKIDEVLATRSPRWAAARDRRRTRARLAFWSATGTFSVPAVSGAVMAFARSTFDRLDGFDERFALYFEEIDFMRRLRKSGGSIVHVSDAKCRHVYNQSAANTGEAAERFAASETIYLRKWQGDALVRMLRFARPDPSPRGEFTVVPFKTQLELEGPAPERYVEASVDPLFRTAAGHFPTTPTVAIPAEIARSYRSEALYVRIVHRASARVEGRYQLLKSL